MRHLLITFLLLASFLPQAYAYDFSEVRQNLQKELKVSRTNRPKVAILFETQDRAELQGSYNLWEVKKDFSEEISKTFAVADPVITQEVFTKNKLSYQDLKDNYSLRKEFLLKNQSTELIFVQLSAKEKSMNLNTTLYNIDQGATASMELQVASTGVITKEQKSFRQTVRQPVKETLAQFEDSVAAFINPDHNDTYMDFSPTAFLIPTTNAFELTIWIKDMVDADIRGNRFRWNWKPLDALQFDAEVNSKAEGGVHSSYLSLKFPFFEDDSVAVAVGARQRVYFDENNPDFTLGTTEVNKVNDDRNSTTLLIIGSARLESLGMIINAYLDNQKVAGGLKYLFNENVGIMLDSYYNFYDDPIITNDNSIALQFYHDAGSVTSLKYQVESDVALLSFAFGF